MQEVGFQACVQPSIRIEKGEEFLFVFSEITAEYAAIEHVCDFAKRFKLSSRQRADFLPVQIEEKRNVIF